MGTETQKYKAFKEQYDAARKQLNAQAQAAFKEFASDFFVEHPKVDSFGWREYTMHWNDGEPCYFSVYSDPESIKINGKGAYDNDDDDLLECCKSCFRNLQKDKDVTFCPGCGTNLTDIKNEELNEKELEAAREAASNLLQQFDDDILEDMYGDHVTVTIFRNGKAEVEEYEHD